MFRFFSTRLRLATVAAATLTAAAALPASAGALIPLGSKTATTKNSVVTAQCGLTVKSVNEAARTETIQLQAEARPSGLAGYFNNVYTQVNCNVNYLNSDGIELTNYFSAFANGPTVSRSTTETFPTGPRYQVCAQATVTQKNGDTTTTPLTCSG
jgi:hypothetical protein